MAEFVKEGVRVFGGVTVVPVSHAVSTGVDLVTVDVTPLCTRMRPRPLPMFTTTATAHTGAEVSNTEDTGDIGTTSGVNANTAGSGTVSGAGLTASTPVRKSRP